MQPTKFIRIRKEEPRGSHTAYVNGRPVTFVKGKWYEVSDPAVIAKCERTRSTFEDKRSPLLFQIVDRIEAEELHKEEAEKLDPTGSPADPVRIAPPTAAERAQFERAQRDVAKLGAEAEEKLKLAQAEREAAEKLVAEAQAMKAAAEELVAQATKPAPETPPAGDETKGSKGSAKR